MTSIANILIGSDAFYNKEDYQIAMKKEFSSDKLQPTVYKYNSKSKVPQFDSDLISQIHKIMHLVYEFFHFLIGKFILRSSSPNIIGITKKFLDLQRNQIPEDNAWLYKRVTIEVDDFKIDTIILGKRENFGNGRWVLASNGNGEFYELLLRKKNHDFKQIIDKVHGSGIVFNYPGVSKSEGSAHQETLAKVYLAMLAFLEYIAAKEIIGYGNSIGGVVQGYALENYDLKTWIKYVFVKRGTFSDLKTIISYLFATPVGILADKFGWNMGSKNSSRNLKVPEIIIQTAYVNEYQVLNDIQKILPSDDVIPRETTLAYDLLSDPLCDKSNKLFIGVPEHHNDEISNAQYLAEAIVQRLNS